ncbi:predicted protein [Nematostella vectensis]|uniref:Nuclear pore complex protein Nup160 n=1 Tax=Nematostella vectensis TaxID=45351 RepID=A7RI66_NEMVE|nr:predicted protein [Nematostella vectensis]|eukprot:XP_001641039.1 predicted protein [Nematostella vectensis]
MLLQGYCHLIAGWGAIFQTHHDFLCGQSHLVTGEHHKALEHFTKAAEGIDEDGSIRKLLQSDSQDPASLVVLYYVKVMRLFEQFEVLDMVISVANTALSIANSKDPNVPNLWSNIFKHHLELGHNDEAYAALTSNPDPSRWVDCLHRFMVVLCERGQLQELCEYPYVNLKDQFVGIMESHARTVDITTHQFYDLLYAFHMFRGDYRKAGNVMYEYGGRLGRELPGKSGLQKQAKCYLAAMNALRLVEPKNAWIVTPWDHAQNKTTEPPNMSPKRKQGDEESWYGDSRPKPRRKLTVLEIGDLEREYLLVLARLQLLRMDADPSQGTGPALTPKETQTLLIQVGLFDTAFTVAETFKLPRDAIFEGLASRCVKLSNGGLDEDGAWDWLRANDSVGPSFSQDKSTADQAWHLLQYYLDKQGTHLDKQGMHEGRSYHRCVATKLLSLGAHLPSWLVNDFKRLSPSELLYLYVTYDMLQEATDLAIEYIHAVQGDGKEHFGLKTALHANMPSVWLPYTTLDHLLVALGEASENSTLAIAREELVEKLERYHDHVERVSETMVTTAWKRAAQTTQG